MPQPGFDTWITTLDGCTPVLHSDQWDGRVMLPVLSVKSRVHRLQCLHPRNAVFSCQLRRWPDAAGYCVRRPTSHTAGPVVKALLAVGESCTPYGHFTRVVPHWVGLNSLIRQTISPSARAPGVQPCGLLTRLCGLAACSSGRTCTFFPWSPRPVCTCMHLTAASFYAGRPVDCTLTNLYHIPQKSEGPSHLSVLGPRWDRQHRAEVIRGELPSSGWQVRS